MQLVRGYKFLFSFLFSISFLRATFSIVAYDPETKEWGVGVASRVLAVGYIVPWAKADIGAIATQALANVKYGTEGLKLLEEGFSASYVLDSLLKADSDREERQVAIVDRNGNVSVFTGKQTLSYAGHIKGKYFSVQGNILAGPDVLTEMKKVFEETEGPLAERILSALKAGENAGGDKRGKQSAAILVVKHKGGYQGAFDRLVDIKVDDHPEPIKELMRIYRLWEWTFIVERYLEIGNNLEREYALNIIDRILQEKPENAEVHNALAWALATRKLYPEKAVKIALRAHKLDPEDPNIMDTIAEAMFAAGKYKEAVKWEEKAIKKSPNNNFFRKQLKKFRKSLKK